MDKKDQVIYVKDLLFTALYRWRAILIFGIIFAILLGGFTAYTGIKEMRAANSVTAPKLAEDQLAKKQVLEQDIARLEAQIATQQTYLAESSLMQLDPNAVYMVGLDIYIDPDPEQDNTPELLYGYVSNLNSAAMTQVIADALQIPQRYAQEMIKISKTSDSNRIVSVKIYGESQEKVIALLDAVETFAQQINVKLSEALGQHQINTVRGTVIQTNDNALNELQLAALNALSAALDSLAAQKKQLETFEVAVPARISKDSVIKKAIIFAVLGAVAGAAIVVGIAWVCHLAGSKVYSARTFKNRTDLTVFSCIPSDKKRCFIDRFLRKKEGRQLEKTQTAIAAATVSTYCGSNKRLMLAGNCDPQSWTQLVKELEAADLQVYCAGSLLENAEAIRQLPNYENILLVEQCDVSSYTNITKTICVTRELGGQLIGSVLIDG